MLTLFALSFILRGNAMSVRPFFPTKDYLRKNRFFQWNYLPNYYNGIKATPLIYTGQQFRIEPILYTMTPATTQYGSFDDWLDDQPLSYA